MIVAVYGNIALRSERQGLEIIVILNNAFSPTYLTLVPSPLIDAMPTNRYLYNLKYVPTIHHKVFECIVKSSISETSNSVQLHAIQPTTKQKSTVIETMTELHPTIVSPLLAPTINLAK
jgi:hypothetical protein